MPYTTTITKEPDYVRILVKGTPTSPGEAAKYADIVIDSTTEHQCHRILLDEIDFHMNVDMLGAIQLTEILIEKDVPSMGLRVAAVVLPENMAGERALETAMRNRSINYRVFDDMETAQQWLLS